jgi:phage head maturation protease
MIQDDLIVRLGRAMQKVMSLSVEKRALAQRLEVAEERAEVLEELIMDVVADMQDGALKSVILDRIRKVMQKLDEEQPDD